MPTAAPAGAHLRCKHPSGCWPASAMNGRPGQTGRFQSTESSRWRRPVVGLTTALDRRRGSIGGGAGRRAAPDGAALGWFGSVRGPKPAGRGDHRRGAFVDGVHELGVVDAAQVHGRDPKVGMPELPLDDYQRYAFARHLDRVCMSELMWRQPATHPGRDRGVAQLDSDPGG